MPPSWRRKIHAGVIVQRIKELIADIRTKYPDELFYKDFNAKIESIQEMRKCYEELEVHLSTVDIFSWNILKLKSISHYFDEREGSRKQGFFNILNESKAYSFLLKNNFTNLEFIPESNNSKSPDIKGCLANHSILCEVKTICISNNEINKRKASDAFSPIDLYSKLNDNFFGKLKSSIETAKTQIKEYSQSEAIGIIYLIINFDDWVGDFINNYKLQIADFLSINYPTERVFIHNFDYKNQFDFAKHSLTRQFS
jgi:hypothetical protein